MGVGCDLGLRGRAGAESTKWVGVGRREAGSRADGRTPGAGTAESFYMITTHWLSVGFRLCSPFGRAETIAYYRGLLLLAGLV